MPSLYIPARQGIYYSEKHRRIVEHRGYATRIFWSTSMTDYLRRHFATTTNEDLAGCLGVSQRTVVRKARELGLEKDAEWLRAVYDERRRMALSASRRKGHPGSFKKGVHNNPAGEFKPGHGESPETRAKRIEALRRWARRNRDKVMARGAKAAQTRRENKLKRESL